MELIALSVKKQKKGLILKQNCPKNGSFTVSIIYNIFLILVPDAGIRGFFGRHQSKLHQFSQDGAPVR
jgi:hypothetical protein